MKYKQMSDEDINHAVLKAIHGDAVDYWALSDCGKFLYDCGPVGEGYHQIKLKDYCNNPADAFAVILENNISLVSPVSSQVKKGVGRWAAGHDSSAKLWAVNENPLRAAMIVFLMMQERIS